MTIVRLDGSPVDVIDADCPDRPCFALGFDKGSFTPGVGYTSYHPVPRRVCWTRHLSGCPHVGVHLKCGDCHKMLALFMEGEERVKPDVCPECGSDDLYWLADVLPDPTPCCDRPDVPTPRRGSSPRWQTCRSCGTRLKGRRLELARPEASEDPR